MTNLESIDPSRLADVTGGIFGMQRQLQQQPSVDAGAQPQSGGGFDQLLGMFSQGLENAGGFISGLQQIVQSIAGFSQMFQSGGQSPMMAQAPDDQSQQLG